MPLNTTEPKLFISESMSASASTAMNQYVSNRYISIETMSSAFIVYHTFI